MKWFKALPYHASYTCCSFEELKTWCKKQKKTLPEIDENYLGGTVAFGSQILVVLFPEKHKTQVDYIDTIIHESVHVFQSIMTYVGETQHGIELPAYFVASISTNLLKESNALHEGWKTGLQKGIPKVSQQS